MQVEIAKIQKVSSFFNVFEKHDCHEAGGHVAGCAKMSSFHVLLAACKAKMSIFYM